MRHFRYWPNALRTVSRTLGVVLFSATVFLSACKQGEGERCQVDSDCAEGLYCCVEESNRLYGGKCFPKDQCETPRDSGIKDGAVKDGAVKDVHEPQDGLANEASPKDTAPDQKPDLVEQLDSEIPADQKTELDIKVLDQAPSPDQTPIPDLLPVIDLKVMTDAASSADSFVTPDLAPDLSGALDTSVGDGAMD